LPQLRARVTAPEKSTLRLTPEMFAVWTERARLAGYPANWRLPDHVLEDSRRIVLGKHSATEDLWVYAYGSLMWDPGFHFAEVRQADLEGYQRRFASRIELGRGSRERPALMLSLISQSGCCRGLAFRIGAEFVQSESAILWRREMIRGGYSPALVPMATPQGPITALAFVANPSHPSYVGELPLDQTAAIIASGAGVIGTNREYLEQLAAQLEALGIEDPYVAQLSGHVTRVSQG
jgi:glutathione-specific gamma-glutamylcyclotransferase